jgi:hypothetical protein
VGAGHQAEAPGADHLVDAIATGLIDHVAGVIDIISVATGAAEHVVGANTAIENVVAAQASQLVGAGISSDLVGVAISSPV